MKSTYTNVEDLPLTLKAHEAAAVLRISKSKVYVLLPQDNPDIYRDLNEPEELPLFI